MNWIRALLLRGQSRLRPVYPILLSAIFNCLSRRGTSDVSVALCFTLLAPACLAMSLHAASVCGRLLAAARGGGQGG